MGNRIAGTCYVKMDGAQLEIKGGLEAPLLEFKREPVVSATGVVGYKETPITPMIKVTAIATRDFPVETLRTATDLTVTAEFANGKVYTLSSAWLANEANAKGDDGEAELEFNGIRGVWQ
jgi:hypothetical protein